MDHLETQLIPTSLPTLWRDDSSCLFVWIMDGTFTKWISHSLHAKTHERSFVLWQQWNVFCKLRKLLLLLQMTYHEKIMNLNKTKENKTKDLSSLHSLSFFFPTWVHDLYDSAKFIWVKLNIFSPWWLFWSRLEVSGTILYSNRTRKISLNELTC